MNFHQNQINKNHPKIVGKKTLGMDKRDTKLISGLLQEVRLQAAPSITQSLDGKKLKQRVTPLSLSNPNQNSYKTNKKSLSKEMPSQTAPPH